MLQQNNNNNHPCMDMGHREMLHGHKRTTAPFSSALELRAIPLIKGLRAWAVSGGYSKSRRKTAPQTPPDGRAGQKSWVSQVASGRRKTEDSIASFHTPGIKQGGLGALVTVATLKGSEGSRQTQTRCLFLKAEGCSYLCTVSNSAIGLRGVSQRVHINLVDGKETTLGRRRGKGDVGAFEVKPQVIPKWRKSIKVARPMEKGLAVESKGSDAFSRLEHGWVDKRDSFITQLEEQNKASTRTSAITQCLKNQHRHADRSIQPGLANQNEMADGSESFNDGRSHLHSTKPHSPPKKSASAKANSSIGEQSLGPKSSNCEVHVEQEIPTPSNSGTDGATDTSQHKSSLVADTNLIHTEKFKDTSFVSGVPKLKKFSSGLQVLTDVASKTNGDTEVKQKLNLSLGESSVAPESRNPSDNNEEEQECKGKDRIGEDTLNGEKEKPMVTIHNGPTENDESLDVSRATHQWADAGQCQEKFAKCPSRGSSFSKAAAAVAATFLLNPAPSTTSNGAVAIATALSDVSKQEEAGATAGNVGQQPGSELLPEKDMGLDGNMVVINERPVVMAEEEEDEFGVFMQAGEDQNWTEGFSELQQVPCRKHDFIAEYTSPLDTNEPVSWTSNWSGVQTSQSVDSWTAFKKNTREEEQEIQRRDAEVQWWSSKAMDSTHLKLSSLHDVHHVFLEAFPCVEPPCGDSDCIPTLNELLWDPVEKNTAKKYGNPKPWDSLQDLDRMIDVKYKGAESMSHKLLLQSLHLGIHNSEHMHRHKQAAARFSPNLPTSSQKLATNAKRRLSYDIYKNTMA